MVAGTDITPIIGALVAGLLPAFLWLMFWLRQDRLHPEPKRMIAISFLAGMLAVILVTFPQSLILDLHIGNKLMEYSFLAFSEEFLKFIMALVLVLGSKDVDEPIDAMIYMITVAIGFAALENTLYVFTKLDLGDATYGYLVGNLRFLGASLLHIICSAIVGAGLSFAFFGSKASKFFAATIGILLATLVHGVYNFLVFSIPNKLLTIFAGVWVAAILILVVFARVRRIQAPNPFRQPVA